MTWLLIAIVLLIGGGTNATEGGNQPTLVFEPAVLEVVRDSTGYVQQMISVRSVTGDSIRLTSIDGSCRCASGSIQRPIAADTIPAKFYIAINAKHFEDSVNYVDYTLAHTGPGSPAVYRVVVRLRPEETR